MGITWTQSSPKDDVSAFTSSFFNSLFVLSYCLHLSFKPDWSLFITFPLLPDPVAGALAWTTPEEVESFLLSSVGVSSQPQKSHETAPFLI